MQYRLEELPHVRLQVRNLPSRVRGDVRAAINDLRNEPFPADAEELRDHFSTVWKIKIDGYRIFYRVKEEDQTVVVHNVKRRDRNTYTSVFTNML